MALLHSAQSLAASLLGLARTRLELFSTELQEELARLLAVIVVAVAALLLAALGAGLAAAALLIALPAEQRIPAATVPPACSRCAAGARCSGCSRARCRSTRCCGAEAVTDLAAVRPREGAPA